MCDVRSGSDMSRQWRICDTLHVILWYGRWVHLLCLILGTPWFRLQSFIKVGSIFANLQNSSKPESNALWYTMIMGHYTLGGTWSISCGQYLDPTLGKFCPIYGPHLSGSDSNFRKHSLIPLWFRFQSMHDSNSNTIWFSWFRFQQKMILTGAK